MKNLTNIFVIISMITPLLCFSQVEENASSGKVKLEGSIGLDANGVFFESTDCMNNGKFYFSPILPIDTDDKKTNKKNAKSNKKTQKKIDKYAKSLGNNVLTNVTVSCLMGTGDNEGKISFGTITYPIAKPVDSPDTPAAEALNKAIYDVAIRLEAIKNDCKIISFAGEKVNGIESVMTYYYGNNCQLIEGMPEDKIRDEVNIKLAKNLPLILGIVAELAQMDGKVKAASDELKSLKPPANIAAGVVNAQAISNLGRVTKEAKAIEKKVSDLHKAFKKADQL